MDSFAKDTLDSALKRVESDLDAAGLARMVMKLTDDDITRKKEGAVWYESEERLLRVMIGREAKSSKEPCFGNIRATLENHEEFFTSVITEPAFASVSANSSDAVLRGVVTGLVMRLRYFITQPHR